MQKRGGDLEEKKIRLELESHFKKNDLTSQMSIITLRILTQFSTGFETFSALSNFFCWATIDGALTECLLKKFETFVMLTLHFQMVRWSN